MLDIKKLINSRIERNSRLFRIISYSLVAFIYYQILFINKLINGFEWHPIHQGHMKRAVDHILNKSIILSSGFTSWSIYSPYIENENNSGMRNYYTAEIYNHLHHAFFTYIGGWEFTLKFGPFLDNFVIFITAIILSEIVGFMLFNEKDKKLYRILFSLVFFIFYFTSPWVATMLVGPWSETSFVFFFSIAIYSFLLKRVNFGIIFYTLACFSSYVWGFGFSLINSIIFIGYCFGGKNLLLRYFPDGVDKSKFKSFYWSIIGFIPFILMLVRKYFFTLLNPEINLGGSSPFSRIGLDLNLFHGGFLPIFQSLGGIKISSCFNDFEGVRIILSKFNIKLGDNIVPGGDTTEIWFIYLCGLSIIGMFIISLISIYGYLISLKSSKLNNFKWILIPMPLAYLLLAAIFQQSFGIHNEGYSYFFSFIFAFGLTYPLSLMIKKISFPFKLLSIFMIVWPIFLTCLRITSYWIPADFRALL